ncbi:MAG: hypothetical protein E6J42_00665 [Chloroflexi bacterium]|nr:MAG: hypothetical protein E6J42_00665 [Chloroflexota bacterium]
MQTAAGWLGRLARFDFTVFDEIRADRTATISAIVIVFGASFLAGMGSWLWAVFNRELSELDRSEVLVKSFLIGMFVQTAVWFLWVYIVRWILDWGYQIKVDALALVRTMGFAFAPVGFSVLVLIGGLALPIGLIAFGATLLLTTAAIQSASEAEMREAMVANLAGFAAFLIVMGGFANIAEVGTFGGLAPGILFFSLDL